MMFLKNIRFKIIYFFINIYIMNIYIYNMKKSLFLIIAAMFAVIIANAQSGWVTHKGDDRISVKFPSEPKEAIPGSFIASQDSSIAYIFTIVDFTKFGIDSVALAPIKTTTEFTSQLKTGMKQSLPDVDLDDFKIGTWKGFTSYTSSGTDSKRKKYDVFMFVIGNNLYSVSTVRAYGIGTKSRDDFFASIQLTH